MPNTHLAIARAARWTRWTVIVLIGASILLQMSAWGMGPSHIQVHPAGRSLSSSVVALLHTIFMLAAIVQLWLMLKQVEEGDLFSAGVTRRLRRFALLMVFAVVSAVILGPLLVLLFPDCAAGQPCARRFPIDVRAFWTLVIALVFFLVARIIDEARRIDEDNRQII